MLQVCHWLLLIRETILYRLGLKIKNLTLVGLA